MRFRAALAGVLLRAGAFLLAFSGAAALVSGDFLAAALFAGAFFAGAFFAGVFLAGAFLAGALVAAFFTGAFFAGAFFFAVARGLAEGVAGGAFFSWLTCGACRDTP